MNENITRPTVFVPAKEPFKSVTEDLASFVHRVAVDKEANPVEIEALPKIAELLYKYGSFGYEGS